MMLFGTKEHQFQNINIMNLFQVFIFSLFCNFSFSQNVEDFINNSVNSLIEKGNDKVIVSIDLCRGCEGLFDCFIIYKGDSNEAKLRYIRYFDSYQKMIITIDTLLSDNKLNKIFQIIEKERDSIFLQFSKIEGLLTDTIVEKGKILIHPPLSEGKLHWIKIKDKNFEVSSLHSVVDLNYVYDDIYYYWLINSLINNYYCDFIKLKVFPIKKKKLKKD